MFAVEIILLSIFFWSVRCQQNIGDLCTVATTKQQGVCKLLRDCPQVYENIFTQPCQGEGSVCCTHDSPRTPGEKSKEKCKEYSKYETERIAIPTASNTQQNNLYVERSLCGQLPSVSNSLAETREFPHVVSIGFQEASNNITWVCGGTIISEEYILTAAHCLYFPQGPAKYVKVGTTDTSVEGGHAEEHVVSKRIPHPNYKRLSHYNDIGLLKLEKPINLNAYARPACLYTDPEIKADKAVAAGWGHYGICPSVERGKLRKSPVDIMDHTSCAKTYENASRRKLTSGILKDSQFCVSASEMVCQTSGAPLQINRTSDDVKCMYDIIGVLSFGKVSTSTADVYTRVSNYVKWIEDTVWP